MKNIKFKTKSEIIYKDLRQEIISGKYQPQQRVIISKVAKEFGTSEIPVREALKNLESEGLIKITPHVGAVVTSINIEEIGEIYELRSMLEGKAAKKAAKNLGQNDFNRLESLITDMDRALQHKEFERLGQLNREFHQSIYSACGNRYLHKCIFELWDISSRASGLFAMVPERARESHHEHIVIFKALKAQDGFLAEKLIIEQKEKSLNSLQQFIKPKNQ